MAEEPTKMNLEALVHYIGERDAEHKRIVSEWQQKFETVLRPLIKFKADKEKEEKGEKREARGRPPGDYTVLAGELAGGYDLIVGTNAQLFAKNKNGRSVYPLEESAGKLGFITEVSERYFLARQEVLDVEVGKRAIKNFATLLRRAALANVMPVAYRSTLVRENDEYVWYYDRCDIGSKERFIRVTAHGDIEYLEHVDHILFITPESAGVAEKPVDCEPGDLTPIETLTKEQWTGLLFWSAYSLLTLGTRVHLSVYGKTGSGKTIVVDWIFASIDPKQGDRAEADLPNTGEDMLIAARNNFLSAYENIDKVPDQKSNTIARMVGNAAINKRELYTNGGLATIAARATCIFTSLEQPMGRTDLLRRAWLFKISESSENSGKSPTDLREEFKQEQPKVLGAIIKLIQGALRNIASAPSRGLPLKADFARWLIAMGEEVGWSQQQILELIKYFEWGGAASKELSGMAWLVEQLVGKRSEYHSSWEDMLKDLEAMSGGLTGRINLPTDEERLSAAVRKVRHELFDRGLILHPVEHTKYRNYVRITRQWTPAVYDAETLTNFVEWRERANG